MTHHFTGQNVESVIGVFRNRADAERAIERLLDAGYEEGYISLVMRSEENRPSTGKRGSERPEAKSEGPSSEALSAVLGGQGGALKGLSLITGPGMGALLAAGPIATKLGEAALNRTPIGLAQALVEIGVRKNEAARGEEVVKEGMVLVAVRTDGTEERAKAVLADWGAVNLELAPRTENRTLGGTMPESGRRPAKSKSSGEASGSPGAPGHRQMPRTEGDNPPKR